MDGKNIPLPTLLVVDDELLIRWSLFESLTDLGYKVCLASSGAEARSFVHASDGQALLVILDLRLPDVLDLTLLGDIRREIPLAPVIVMSAYGTSETRAEALALGAARFVDKPFDVPTIAELVREVWAARAS